MPVYLHSHLFVGDERTVDIAGPHIQVIDNLTGDVCLSTTTFSGAAADAVLKSGPVRCAAVDSAFQHLLTSGEDKLLKVWELDGLKLLNVRELPKKPTSATFTKDGQTIIVSDKFGDIFSYPLNYTAPEKPAPEPSTPSSSKGQQQENKRDSLASHENPSDGTLILGHTSPLNAFVLSADERHIISADRDEHIRVSRYPKGYIIQSYCLGHLKFVSAVHILPFAVSNLISGGGDPVLKVWNWMNGKLLHEISVWEAVEPFVVVRPRRKKRGWDGDEEDLPPVRRGRGKKSKNKKGKAQAAAEQEDEGEDEEQTAEPATEDKSGEGEQPLEKVLVVQKISSVQTERGPYIVFSAVGSTALFSFQYDPTSTSKVHSIDLGRPIVNFTISDETIVVTLDIEWSDGSTTAASTDMVRSVRVVNGELVEDRTARRALIDSLNSKSLLAATSEELKMLDIYSDLTSMPKYSSNPEASARASGFSFGFSPSTDKTVIPVGAPELSTSRARSNQEPTRKELGRMKRKQKVIEQKGKNGVRKEREEEEEDGRETKRSRGDEDEDVPIE